MASVYVLSQTGAGTGPSHPAGLFHETHLLSPQLLPVSCERLADTEKPLSLDRCRHMWCKWAEEEEEAKTEPE